MILGRAEIEALIPHRAPILMLDRVVELVPGERGTGEADLPPGAACFAGHFPGVPIVPGAFIVEACGQLLAVVLRTAMGAAAYAGEPPIEYLASIERFKFLSPAVPDEILRMDVRVGRRAAGLLSARVSASVAGRAVAEGVLNVTAQR